MADISIQIDKTEVYEDVAKVTAYIGGKNVDANGKSFFDQVFVTEADNEMIDGFWAEATSNASTALHHSLKSFSLNDDAVITLQLPGNFKKSILNALSQNIKDYIENSIIAAWCAVVKKDEESYATKATALLQQISAMQYLRQRPKRNF